MIHIYQIRNFISHDQFRNSIQRNARLQEYLQKLRFLIPILKNHRCDSELCRTPRVCVCVCVCPQAMKNHSHGLKPE